MINSECYDDCGNIWRHSYCGDYGLFGGCSDMGEVLLCDYEEVTNVV